MKNYLIVGASSGVGKALAEQLAAEGHKVYGTYFQHKVEDTESIAYHYLDSTATVALDFLPEQLDGLVYCPGALQLLPFHRISREDFLADYTLQVIGATEVIKAALPRLKKSPSPCIILYSTVAVQSGFNFHSQVSMSKGAIEGLTKALAAEFAPAIRVNAIAPSLTDTPLAAKLLNSDLKRENNNQRHPLKRVGRAEDIAQATAFLLSDQASWITGQILHVDGGMSTLKV